MRIGELCQGPDVLECVVNVSEGSRLDMVEAIAGQAGRSLLDVHTDGAHNRTVLTLAGPAVEDAARAVAAEVRGTAVRALGLDVGGVAQVSCNLIDPAAVGPGALVDAVAARAEVARTELVGLVPASVLAAEAPARWRELDLDESRTIEARLERAGLDGGRFA